MVTIHTGWPSSAAIAFWWGAVTVTTTAMPLLVSSAVATVVPPVPFVNPLLAVTVWLRVVASEALPLTR